MKRGVAILLASGLFGATCIPAQSACADAVREAGDVLQIALPALALGMTAAAGDREGLGQFLESGALTASLTFGLKYAIDSDRPAGGGGHSFPSGHTAAAFAGASFLARRYGWRLGLPAYGAASFVAFSRVDSDRHHVEDVVAAAAIAIVSTHLFTRPLPDGIRCLPVAGRGSYGFLVQALW